MKRFAFVNEAAKRSLKELPHDVRLRLGADLQAVQRGEKPVLPVTSLAETVGRGAFELKINGSPAFRVVYCAKFGDTVFILHAFTKTTNDVDRKELETARQRYRLMLEIASRL